MHSLRLVGITRHTLAALLLFSSGAFTRVVVQPDLAGSSVDLEQVRSLEVSSWVAWQAQDASFFEANLSEDHVEIHGYGITGKTSVVSAIRSRACTVQSYALGPLTLRAVAPDSILVTYRAEQDTRCGSAKVPSPTWTTSLYFKRSGRWLNVLYQQTPAT